MDCSLSERLSSIAQFSNQSVRKIERIEILQVFDTLPYADLVERQFQFMSDRHRDAALCSAIELGDDDAIEVERLVELTCLLKAVLPRGRIDDEHGIDPVAPSDGAPLRPLW